MISLKNMFSHFLYYAGIKIIPIRGRFLIVKVDSSPLFLSLKMVMFIIFTGFGAGLIAFALITLFPGVFTNLNSPY
jgi:hypothetical protein